MYGSRRIYPSPLPCQRQIPPNTHYSLLKPENKGNRSVTNNGKLTPHTHAHEAKALSPMLSACTKTNRPKGHVVFAALICCIFLLVLLPPMNEFRGEAAGLSTEHFERHPDLPFAGHQAHNGWLRKKARKIVITTPCKWSMYFHNNL